MKSLVLFSCVFAVSGCGLQHMPDKMDSTNNHVQTMSDKMDDTNSGLHDMNGKMDTTNGQLQATNQSLGDMKAELAATNAAVTAMSQKLDQTNKGLAQTNDGLTQTNKGIGDLDGKMDQTNKGLAQTNDGLAQTNKALGQTNAEVGDLDKKVDQTNAGVASLNGAIATTNAGVESTNDNLLQVLKQIQQTNAGMSQMNGQMATTNAAIHNQVLLLALQEMQSPDNTMVLLPPVGMTPAGQKFANEATPEDVLELNYAWLLDLDQATIDASTLASQGYTADKVKQMQATLEHDKDAKLMGLEIIDGYLPPATVDALIQHVEQNGRYRTSALAALTLRASYIQGLLLDYGLFTEKLTDFGKMVEAIEDVALLDQIARLPFVAEIQLTTQHTGLMQFTAHDTMLRLYQEIDRRFDADLDPVYHTQPTDPTLAAQVAELATLRKSVKDGVAYWQGHP